MIKAKRYKTVAGALRAISDKLWRDQYKAELKGGDPAAAKTAVNNCIRHAINGVLPQIGIVETIGPDEEPKAAINRMLAMPFDDKKKKHLTDIRRFIKNVCFTISATMTEITVL